MAPPAPAARRCSHGTPRPPRPPPVASGPPLDPLPPKRCPPGATELALCGDGAPRSALAQRCWRRRRRDRRTPRRRVPARSACPHGVTGGPRPEQCPETLSGGDSARARRRRAAPVRPRSALPLSLPPSPPPPPRPTHLPGTRGRGTPRGMTSPADAPRDGTAPRGGGGARQCDRQTLSEGRPARGRRWCRRGPRGQQARTSR